MSCCKNHKKCKTTKEWEDYLNEDDEDIEEEEDEDDEEELEEDDDFMVYDEDEEEEDEEMEEPKIELGKYELHEALRICGTLIEVGFFKKSKAWFTTSQAAKWYDVNERTVRRWVEGGKIKYMDIGDYQSKYLVEVDLRTRWFDPIESKEIW